MFGGNHPRQQSRYRQGILPYMVLESPGITLYGHWVTPVVMEYNYRQGNTVPLYTSNI